MKEQLLGWVRRGGKKARSGPNTGGDGQIRRERSGQGKKRRRFLCYSGPGGQKNEREGRSGVKKREEAREDKTAGGGGRWEGIIKDVAASSKLKQRGAND